MLTGPTRFLRALPPLPWRQAEVSATRGYVVRAGCARDMPLGHRWGLQRDMETVRLNRELAKTPMP